MVVGPLSSAPPPSLPPVTATLTSRTNRTSAQPPNREPAGMTPYIELPGQLLEIFETSLKYKLPDVEFALHFGVGLHFIE